MRVREQKVQLALAQLELQRCLLPLDLRRQVRVVCRQLGQLGQVPRSLLQGRPAGDLVTELAGLPRERTRRLRIVPDPGPGEPPVEVG